MRRASAISSLVGIFPISRSTIAATLSAAIASTFATAALRLSAIDCSAAASRLRQLCLKPCARLLRLSRLLLAPGVYNRLSVSAGVGECLFMGDNGSI
jgi:hypothetical protein